MSAAPESNVGEWEFRSSQRRQLLLVWCAPVFVVLLIVGMVPLMGFVPPQSPTDSAEQIAAAYRSDLTSIRLGIVLCIIGVSLLAMWGVALAVRTRRTEGPFPAFTYAQLVSTAIATIIAVLIFVVWGVAAFRPDDVSPETTRMLNDLGWFLFLFDTPPFMLWCIVIGLSILMNASGHRHFPRWSGYLALWIALLQAPPLCILFFKTGPLAINGLIAFWTTLFSFLTFVLVMSALLTREIKLDTSWQDSSPERPA